MPNRNIEAIVILGSGKYESQRRARTAISVLRKYGVPGCRVFACGEYPHRNTFERIEKKEAEYIAEVFEGTGINVEKECKSKNTYENLRNVSADISEVSNIAIITSRAHTFRANRLARKLWGNKNIKCFAAETKNFKDVLSDFAYMLIEVF